MELERTRELGLLRALGMTQAGLSCLLLVETGLTGLIAGLVSVPVGIGIAATLVYFLYERCFGWSMDLYADPVIVAQWIALAATPPAGPLGVRRPRSCAMTERGLARSPTANVVIIAVLIGGTALTSWATSHRPPPEKETEGVQ